MHIRAEHFGPRGPAAPAPVAPPSQEVTEGEDMCWLMHRSANGLVLKLFSQFLLFACCNTPQRVESRPLYALNLFMGVASCFVLLLRGQP